jgi:hypothetical protein
LWIKHQFGKEALWFQRRHLINLVKMIVLKIRFLPGTRKTCRKMRAIGLVFAMIVVLRRTCLFQGKG